MAPPKEESPKEITVPLLGKYVLDNIHALFRNENTICGYFSFDYHLDEGAFIFTIKKKNGKVFYYFDLPIDKKNEARIPHAVYELMKQATFERESQLTADFADQFALLQWVIVGNIQYYNV